MFTGSHFLPSPISVGLSLLLKPINEENYHHTETLNVVPVEQWCTTLFG